MLTQCVNAPLQPRPRLHPKRNTLSDRQTERVTMHFWRSKLYTSTGEGFFFLVFFVHEFNTEVSTWRQAVLFSYEDIDHFFCGSSEWLWPNDKQQLDLWIKPSMALVTIFDGFNTNRTLVRHPPHPHPHYCIDFPHNTDVDSTRFSMAATYVTVEPLVCALK